MSDTVGPRGIASIVATLRARAAGSGRLMAARLLARTSRPLAVAVALLALANALLPNLAVVAMGIAVGALPAAVTHGSASAAGHHLYLWLAVAGALYVLSLLSGPYQDWLSTVVKARLTDAVQGRLLAAVSGPIGIAHLEDPDVLNKLELAQGTLMSYYPGDAPVMLAVVAGNRLSGAFACLLIATFRWWLGLGLLAMWLAVRGPMRRITFAQVKAFQGQAGPMRRAWYFRQLALRPAAAKELRVFGLGAWVIDQYRTMWSEAMVEIDDRRRDFRRRARLLGSVVTLVYVGACSTLGYAALHHQITLGTLAVMLPMLGLTMSSGLTADDVPLEFMVSSMPDIDDVETRLAATPLAWTGTGAAAGLPVRGVRFEQVSFRYPRSERAVLDRLDLEIPAGTSTAIVGVNGAGKTTIVKLLARLHDPSSGRITADGIDLAALDPSGWQRQVAVVFQDFNRYPLTARENVAFGSLEHADDGPGITRATERAGTLAVVESLPSRWDTVLSRQYPDGVDLSGGQWQRVALARAMFAVEHGARVLVLDEPTAWLDARAEAEFFDRFLDITQGVTSVVISHRFSTVRRAGRICVLADGALVEQGGHDELMALGGRYAEMFTLQASRFGSEDGDA